MPGIARLHWDALGRRSFEVATGALFALWPEPVNADACFARAGFECFADPDDSWDDDLERLVRGIGAALGRYGEAVATGVELVTAPRRLWRAGGAARLSPWQRLAIAATDGPCGPCRVDLGAPAVAATFASDGHPIFWIWLNDRVADDWQRCLQAVASERAAIATRLRWVDLLPASLPFRT